MYEHKSILWGAIQCQKRKIIQPYKNPKVMENNFVNSVSIGRKEGRKEWWRFVTIKIYPTVR